MPTHKIIQYESVPDRTGKSREWTRSCDGLSCQLQFSTCKNFLFINEDITLPNEDTLFPTCILPSQNWTIFHDTYTLSLWSAPIPESRLSSEYRELSSSEAMESGFMAGPSEEKSPPRTWGMPFFRCLRNCSCVSRSKLNTSAYRSFKSANSPANWPWFSRVMWRFVVSSKFSAVSYNQQYKVVINATEPLPLHWVLSFLLPMCVSTHI